jgi:aminopeptidase N
MKKLFYLFFALLFCFNLGFTQSNRTQLIDVKHIVLDLRFDWTKKQAFGTATITLLPLSQSQNITLDAASMTINSVFDEKNQALKFDYESNNLKITLNRKYNSSEELTIKIDYRTNHENRADPNAIAGSFGKGLRFFQPTSTTPAKRKQLWSSGEPESNKYWFPCHEYLADLHTTEVIATVEKPLMVVSNGELIKLNVNKDGSQTFHYQSIVPFPNYLVSLVVGEYTPMIQQSGKTIIQTFGYPDEKEAVAATVELLPQMIQFLEEKTGYNYPFQTYKQVVVQDYPYPGLVGQHGVSLLSDNYIDDFGVHKDFKYLWDGVAVQALANQWFGNLIMPKNWNDLWLNNAFAQYFAGQFTEKDNSRAEYLLWYYPFEKGSILNDWQNNNRHPIVPEKIKDLPTFTTDSYSKFKGALVLQMLQKEIGDELWWKAVRYFVSQNAHKQVVTKDFQELIEKVSGKSYQWFFDQWIYKMGLPELVVSKKYDASEKKLSISIIQNQAKDDKAEYPQTEFFEGKIKVEIDGKIESIYLLPQKETVVNLSVETTPSFVNFNVEQGFLCETKTEKSKEEYFAQLQKSKDYLAKQEAINQLVAIAKDSTTSLEFKQIIKEVLTQEVQSKHYWRHRMAALWALANMSTLPYDEKTIQLVKTVIQQEKAWLKSSAISILGRSNDAAFVDIYTKAMTDESDRVINAAAIALGKTKSPKSFEILMNLEHQKSWKNQNRISALNGLQQLGDARATEYALNCIKDNRSPRWYLATPVWDYPFAAVNTLVALGKADLAYPILFERFKKSLEDDDINDIFQYLQLIDLLKDKRATEVYVLLKTKFKNDAEILTTINVYEEQFKNTMK